MLASLTDQADIKDHRYINTDHVVSARPNGENYLVQLTQGSILLNQRDWDYLRTCINGKLVHHDPAR